MRTANEILADIDAVKVEIEKHSGFAARLGTLTAELIELIQAKSADYLKDKGGPDLSRELAAFRRDLPNHLAAERKSLWAVYKGDDCKGILCSEAEAKGHADSLVTEGRIAPPFLVKQIEEEFKP